MPNYHYKASDPHGSIRHGWLKAENERDLELHLSHLDLLLISYTLNDNRSLPWLRTLFSQRVDRKTLIMFCILMRQMLAAGNSIPAALEGVQESIDSSQFREVITSILGDIQNGKNFSDALESYSSIIPPSIASLVRVGEKTGNMVDIFHGLAENLKWEDELQAQAVQAIRYPAFTGVIIFGVGFFMMVYIVPQLMSFLSQMQEDIPMLTEALIIFSNFLINWWWTLFLVPALSWVTTRILCHFSKQFHLKLDRFKLRIWIFGPLLYKMFLIRFTTNFALMYKSGIPVLDAIRINVRLSENREVVNRIENSITHVSNGMSISAAFKESKLFPPPLPKLMEAGEEGGQLPSAMINAGYFLDREVRESVTKIQAMIEPVLTLTMGLMLVWIIVSVLIPIYQVVGTIDF
jgi:type IV pilus assembly protein PilC